MKKLIIILFAISIFLTPSVSNALRWNHSLIQIGDYSCIILQKYGQPKYKEIIRKGVKYPKIEHWLYEKSDGYYYILIFKGGILTKIKSIRK